VEDRPDLLVHLLFGVNETREFQEATLIVNLAESSKKELVWRAVIRENVGDDLEKNFQMVNKGVAKAFKDYPRPNEVIESSGRMLKKSTSVTRQT
jgi:hypothetical protein